jgi:hypothetical protein
MCSSNDCLSAGFTPAIGSALGGGYFAGQILDGTTVYNLIVAPIEGNTSGPATGGALKGQYGGTTPTGIAYKTSNSADLVADQNAVYGGTTSDRYKASGVHPLFNTTWLNNATGPNGGTMNLATGGLGGGAGIGGYTDWYVPAKNELAILYFFLKPGTTANSIGSGSNPNSVAPYTPNANYGPGFPDPANTPALFVSGSGAQAFTPTPSVYWSATEFSGGTGTAWSQFFSNGGQSQDNKSSTNPWARAVRRMAA